VPEFYSTGRAQDGTVYYAFVAVKPSLYKEFHKKSAACMPLRLIDYGEILASGVEAQSPEHVIVEMKQKYGIPLPM
jgi:hypothetical protein